MATERVLSNLNLITFKTEDGLQNHIDELQDGDLVFTPDKTTEALNGKADIDLSNAVNSASQMAKETIIAWGMPDYSAGVSAPSTNTIAQTDIYVKSDTQTLFNSQIYINDVIVASGWEGFACAYVPKGATFRVTGTNAVYYPLKGVN